MSSTRSRPSWGEAEQALRLHLGGGTPNFLSAAQRGRGAGFRRISYGVQDFDPLVQQAIGRSQPESVVRQAVAQARETGLEGLNIDRIYGLPAQTDPRFERTLDTALTLAPDRVVCYSYAHVPQARPTSG